MGLRGVCGRLDVVFWWYCGAKGGVLGLDTFSV